MNLRLLLSAVVAGVLGSGISQAAPLTDVVFGNLGASGTNALSTTSTDVGPTLNDYLAQGFTAASPSLTVTTVSLGLFGDGSIPTTVGIFADNFGAPAASPLYTSNTVNVGAKSTYSFSFTGASLTNGATYWVMPLADVSWYLNSPGSVPVGQNSSGYTFVNTLENIGGAGWTGAGSNRYSLSVAAVVPEPSTWALAAVGLGVAGFVRARRRKAAV